MNLTCPVAINSQHLPGLHHHQAQQLDSPLGISATGPQHVKRPMNAFMVYENLYSPSLVVINEQHKYTM